MNQQRPLAKCSGEVFAERIEPDIFGQDEDFVAGGFFPRLDITRFNRHLLRPKLNWRNSYEDSEVRQVDIKRPLAVIELVAHFATEKLLTFV